MSPHPSVRWRTAPFVVAATCAAFVSSNARAQDPARVASPDGRTVATAIRDGRLTYAVERDGRACSCRPGSASSLAARRRCGTVCA
jgi:hypothetical protein